MTQPANSDRTAPELNRSDTTDVGYDEFSMLVDNASEAGLWFSQPSFTQPSVRRDWVPLASGQRLSVLRWGDEPPELVLIHGGAQNAHTWDTVALALGRPLLAIDLPGHGHSDWRDEHDYWPPTMADDVAVAVEKWAPDAKAVVGMSLGGLTAICLAAQYPHLVARLGIIDVTPGTDHKKAEGIVAFISGPEFFDNFDAILARTIEHNPTRTEPSLRRGVLHNARGLPDGRWSWRYDPARGWKSGADKSGLDDAAVADYFGPLWDKVDEIEAPIWLMLGGSSPVVGPEDVVEFQRRQPTTVVHTVEGAGHSIQGDKPVELAGLLGQLMSSGLKSP